MTQAASTARDKPLRTGLLAAFCLMALPTDANAQHHWLNVPGGSDCTIREYRKQTLTPDIYDALCMASSVTGTEGNPLGGWYGGAIHYPTNTRVFYSFWPTYLAYPAGSIQKFLYAGERDTNAEWHVDIGEGTLGGVTAEYPVFATNQWYRFATRYWQSTDGTAHVGYQGQWMRDAVTGNWIHQCTVQYPFEATGVDGLGGFQENFAGSGVAHRAEYRNAYYHKNGVWAAAKNFTSDGFNGNLELIDGGTAVASQSWGADTTATPANLRGTSGMTLTTVNQPNLPTFDPILFNSTSARALGSQLLVQWQTPATSSPQLSYKIEVFNNPAYTGVPAVTVTENEPEARQKLLDIIGVATPFVRLTLSDIFHNDSVPSAITPTAAVLTAAGNVAGTVGGLNYKYYEAASGVNWTALPNTGVLSAVQQGAVSAVDVTPRKRRSNYAFEYNGFINVPASGLYSFTLKSGDGSKLTIDGQSVVNFDGIRISTDYASGWMALQAGQHAINVQYFRGSRTDLHDGLGLFYEGPGLVKSEIPASAFTRTAAAGEPTVSIASPAGGAALDNASVAMSANVVANGASVDHVRFYLSDFYSFFYRPNQRVDYLVGQDSTAPYTLNSMVWSAPVNQVRARVTYNTVNTIDSEPVSFSTTNASVAPWAWSPLEVHNYPSGASAQADKVTLLGDGMNLISRTVTGDCTLTGHLASLPANSPGPDGVAPDDLWRAGIILRGNNNATIGQPLGNGTTTRFAALFSSVGGGTYFQDDTMRNGNSDANRWSGDLGGVNRWYKIQRVGNNFTSSLSADGVAWNVVNTVTLDNFGNTILAGFFIHAVQSQNPNIHVATFDGFSLTGAGVQGPTSVTATPLINSVLKGLPATFTSSVVGPAPSNYQWRFNGADIPGATSSTYTVSSVTTADAGNYTVVVNGVTSPPATLVISNPPGSGVWTNEGGGSWTASGNWSGGTLANTTDAVADFGTLNLAANRTVTLDGAKTIGAMFTDDQNAIKHTWTFNTGTGGTLTLATNSGVPTVVADVPTTIGAVVTGTQGFIKYGGGTLTLSGMSTITGTIQVAEGTLEVTKKSGDCPYTVASGTTLKIGYTTGGGYANTGLTIKGDGADATTGFCLLGGKTYNASGQIILQQAPTTIRQYGTGVAKIGTYDTNGTGLWCMGDASGSTMDANIQMVSSGFGMSVKVDPGLNTLTGDLTINGPLNVGSLGFHKRGSGSVRLKGAATSSNTAVNVLEGAVLCGVTNCLGTSAKVPVSSGAKLSLNGYSQTVASISNPAGATVSFDGPATLTATTATLGGTLRMAVKKGATPDSSRLVSGNALAFSGALLVDSQGGNVLAQSDTFQLFSAPGYSGAFASISLPALPVGLAWDITTLSTTGSISVGPASTSQWNGGGADNNWGTALNWNGVAPANGQVLSFQGTTRLSAVNNVLTTVGQIVFANGGFSLSGTAVNLQWGLLNQAGNNTWGIASTLLGPQSFTTNSGTLTVSKGTANGGFDLTLNGAGSHTISGVISGTGGLVKNGTGTTALSGSNTYSGGTSIIGGILDLTGSGGPDGTIRGTATVKSGGTLRLSTGDATGYGGGPTCLTEINLEGGTLDVNTTSNQTLGGAIINLTGASISGNTGGNIDFFGGASSLNTFASSTTSTISGVRISPLRQGSTTFSVAAGTTPSGIDLDISSILRTAPSGDAVGGVLYKEGAGSMRLSAANTYARPTTVNAGTLLVDGSLAAGSTMTVASGGRLGGIGTINGPTTISPGGTLAPGSPGIGTLTINNTLSLSGTTRMEISKVASTLGNDRVKGLTTVTYGGSLDITDTGSAPFADGDSFQLFSATNRSGNFSAINLPGLATGLVWDTGALATTGTIAVARGSQEITFGALATRTFGGGAFPVNATASSGLPVSFASSNPAVATISGGTVTIVGAGSTTITASQAGNSNYLPAPDVARTLQVNKASAGVVLSNLSATYDGSPKPVTATTNPSGLPVVLTYGESATTPPSAAGSYAVNATVNHPDYSGGTTGTLEISNSFVIGISETQVYQDVDLTYSGLLNDGTLILGRGSLHITADAVNNGVIRLFGNAVFDVAGSFTNNGTIDIINWSDTLPPGLVNNGIILDRSAVRVLSAYADATRFQLAVPGFEGHSYQLETSGSLVDSWLEVGTPQLGTGSATSPLPLNFSPLQDGSSRFYRVTVTPADRTLFR